MIPNANVVEQAPSKRYVKGKGWQTVRNFRGGKTEIEAQADLLILSGYDIDIDAVGGGVYTMAATVGGNVDAGGGGTDEPVDTWELFGNESEKDILQANIAAVNSLSAADRALLRKIVDGKIDEEQYTTTLPQFTATGSGDPVGIWQLHLAGVNAITFFQPVLRHTKTVSSVYEIPASLTFVGQIVSTARLVQTETVPADIASNLSSSEYVTKSGISNQFYLGWFKCAPVIQAATGGKRQIVQEWRWGLWPSSPEIYTINP